MFRIAGDIANCLQPKLFEAIGRNISDTPQACQRQRMQEGQQVWGCDNAQAVGLVDVRGDFGRKFIGGNACGHHQPELAQDAGFEFKRNTAWRP